MGKIKYYIMTLFLVFPVIISAGTYDVEVNKANNLLNKENFVHTYEKYIVNGNGLKFQFTNNTNSANSSFIRGGFISMDEYNLTKNGNASYLFEGIEYWTLSTSGSNVYAITYNDINTPKSKSSSYNGRVTEFVNPSVTIHGEGKLNNPWTFDPIYKVSAKVDNRYATIESGNDAYVKGGCTNNECTARIKIVGKTGYRYIANDCDGLYDDTTKILTVNNVKRDTSCKVTFGRGLYIVTLNKGTPNKIYLKYGENYYKEFQVKNIIRSIEGVQDKTGYTFIGYFYNGHKIINGLKEPNTLDNKKILYESVTGKYITSDVTLDPSWEANKYTVTFDCNGGNTEPGTQVATYDQTFTLTSSVCRRLGFTQSKWNTKADGTGETWTTSNKTNVTWQIAHNVKLYAIWDACPAGTYSPESSNECIACPEGSYCDTVPVDPMCTGPKCIRHPVLMTCPDGYTSEFGAININKCYLTVEAGKYLGTANGTTRTECATGTYKEKHTVYYGSRSSCNNCPEGYRAGTAIDNKKAENTCLKSVDAGYKVGTAKGQETVCDNGYYKGAHTITYGQTSSCTQCPEGYRAGTAIDNKKAENTCLKSVAAGYKVGTAKGQETVCDNGYYKGAHTITYGQTSSCTQCPEGYRDGTSVNNKTAQNTCLKNVSAGYYIKKANDKNATACDAGTYSTKHSKTYGQTSSCTVCVAGTYNLTTSQSSCITCENGYYCGGGTDKHACPAGKIGTGTGKTTEAEGCSACGAGTYNTGTGNTTCIACEAGTYNTGTGNTSCTACRAGTYNTGTGNTSCTACGAGTYNTGTKNTSCTACGSGTYNTGTGNTSCTACVAGTYNTGTKNTSCTACAGGTYNTGTGNTSCTACAGGTYNTGTGNTSCTACAGGTYNTGTGNTSCTACAGGTYNTGTGNTSCTKCRAGTYNTGTGNTSCTNCPSDQWSNEGATSCFSKCNSTGSWQCGSYGSYGNCSVECGGGTKTRTRTCNKYSNYDSSYLCDTKTESDSASCNERGCCSSTTTTWGGWSEWSRCSAECGGGTQTRTRSGTKYSNYDNSDCGPDSDSQSQTCNSRGCCDSTTASCGGCSWSGCSAACGWNGTQSGSKTCTNYSNYNGQQCGNSYSVSCGSQACNRFGCCVDTHDVFNFTNCSACSKTCGGGTQQCVDWYKTVSDASGDVCNNYATNSRNVSCNTHRCGGGCFLAGTKVKTIFGYKDIDKIKKGDIVLTYNEETGKNEYKEVLEKLVHVDYKERLFTLNIDGKDLQVTEDHRFYIRRDNSYEWVSAKNLKVGDMVRYSNRTYHKILSTRFELQTNTVYNLTIKDNHNYYVGYEEILVHNAKDTPDW